MALQDHADHLGGHITGQQLESYLLGALPAAQEDELEAHLLQCAGCRGEADASSVLAVAVASLAPEDVRAIESGKPPDHASRRHVVAYAAVMVVGFVVGVVGVLWILPGSINGLPAGNESLDTPSGRLTVTLTDRGDTGADVRAVVIGLRPDVAYELVAVGRDGRNHIVARGVAAGGPQTLEGRLDGPAVNVLFFAVVQPDAGVLFVTPAP